MISRSIVSLQYDCLPVTAPVSSNATIDRPQDQGLAFKLKAYLLLPYSHHSRISTGLQVTECYGIGTRADTFCQLTIERSLIFRREGYAAVTTQALAPLNESAHFFSFSGVHPDLLRCLNHVFVRGCEVDYMGPVANTSAFCPPKGVEENAIDASANHQRRRRRKSRTLDVLQSPATNRGRAPQQTSAGSLVVHIRSGDIFNAKRMGGKRSDFGQVGSY